MRVMLANNTGREAKRLAAKYADQVGHLYSPDGWRNPRAEFPYALDNGRYPCWSRGRQWDADKFARMLSAASVADMLPLWVVVPDVVADRDATLREWDLWAPRLECWGWPLAMAVQDGMTAADVPSEADVVFVGGSTTWKRLTLWRWCEDFPRVHVARINGERWLWECHDAGAESCDGSGWFHGDQRQLRGLHRYLAGNRCQRFKTPLLGLAGLADFLKTEKRY